MICPGLPVLSYLSWVTCPGLSVFCHLSLVSGCVGCPGVPSWVTCPGPAVCVFVRVCVYVYLFTYLPVLSVCVFECNVVQLLGFLSGIVYSIGSYSMCNTCLLFEMRTPSTITHSYLWHSHVLNAFDRCNWLHGARTQ